MTHDQLTLRRAKFIAAPIVWSGYAYLLLVVTPLKQVFMNGYDLLERAGSAHESFLTSGLFGFVGLVLAVGWTFAVMFAVFSRQLIPMGILAVLMGLSSGGAEAVMGWSLPLWNAATLEALHLANLSMLICALLLSLATTHKYCSLVYRSRRVECSTFVSNIDRHDSEAGRGVIKS